MLLFALGLVLPVLASAGPPQVTLRQGSFTGITLQEDRYNTPVNAFLGIPYAQPPVGNLRLRPPVALNTSSDAFNATAYGFQCPQSALVPAYDPDTPGMSEDCLTINIFQPTGVNFTNEKVPVGINIHPGSFNMGAGKQMNVSTMVSWSGAPFIGVSINYRLGALGFLPSTLSEQEGSLNIGLKDQIQAFRWVQDNIAEFGGDPDQVTLYGPSAGGHSVGHHLMNLEEGTPALFHRVIIEDGAPTARRVPPANDTFVNQQFMEFLQLAGCANETSSNIFPCLRSLPSDNFVNASVSLYANYSASVRWPFQPVVDGEIIRLRPTLEWESNQWNKVPIMTGFATDEGSIFVPPLLNTSQGFTDFMATLIPAFNQTDLDEMNALYPDPLTDPNSIYVDTRPIPVGREYKRVTAAYGQYSYICNVITTTHLAPQGQEAPVWAWHWATNASLVTGAFHISQLPYETYEPYLRNISTTQDAIAQHVNAYWTSFIATGDPNKVRTGLGKDRPQWGTVNSGEGGRIMVLGQGNDERAGGSDPGVVAQMEKNDWPEKECAFWNARSEKLGH